MATTRTCDFCAAKLPHDEPLGMARISITTDVNEMHLDACGPCLTRVADRLRELSRLPEIKKAIFEFQVAAENPETQPAQEF